eukprot:2995720-Rhodomonas_salina.2
MKSTLATDRTTRWPADLARKSLRARCRSAKRQPLKDAGAFSDSCDGALGVSPESRQCPLCLRSCGDCDRSRGSSSHWATRRQDSESGMALSIGCTWPCR